MSNSTRSFLYSLTISILLLPGHVMPVAGVDLLYDFEGDSGSTVTDKWTSDGAQNGEIFQNVDPADTQVQMFGSQSAFFDLPLPGVTVPPYSTIEIPDTTFDEDFSLTLAGHFRNVEDPLDFTRIFSSFGGTGPVSEQRLLLDYDVTGGQIPGLRAILNNTVVQTESVPSELSSMVPGEYHHFAVTIDAGEITGFVNGVEVLSGDVGFGYTNDQNIFIGEDPHDLGGSADEQFVGNVDEFLLIERALPASAIEQLAAGSRVDQVVTPAADERAVYYDFEGPDIVDRFTGDGAQDPFIELEDFVLAADTAAVGTGAVEFKSPKGEVSSPFSQINIGPVGDLGSEFTISATIHALGGGQNGGGLARILSTYPGSGGVAGRFILDFNPAADVQDIGIRLILPDGTVLITDIPPEPSENETITTTFDQGEVTLYLNGEEVAATTSLATSVDLGEFDLRIGEDLGGAFNENFVGNIDDVLILGRALSPAQVLTLHEEGAASIPPPITSLPLDCNRDGLVDAADVACADASTIADTLTAAELLAGDLDFDGSVAFNDFLVLSGNFGNSGVGYAGGDIDLDNTVAFGDFLAMSANFGQSLATSHSVPEPHQGLLLGIGLLLFCGSLRNVSPPATKVGLENRCKSEDI